MNNNVSGLLDNDTAYAAMYEFLVDYYKRTNSDDIGGLLGSMSTLADGGTADPAIWHDWLLSIEKAKANKVDTALRFESD
jgi:hypothetical protein